MENWTECLNCVLLWQFNKIHKLQTLIENILFAFYRIYYEQKFSRKKNLKYAFHVLWSKYTSLLLIYKFHRIHYKIIQWKRGYVLWLIQCLNRIIGN